MDNLERHAIDAHAAGMSWPDFWAKYDDAVRSLERYNLPRFHRLAEWPLPR